MTDKLLIDRSILAGLISQDRETRIHAERELYGVLANAQPAPAEGEAVEVAGTLFTALVDDFKSFAVIGDCKQNGGEFYRKEPLMTVAQHQRIVAALSAGK